MKPLLSMGVRASQSAWFVPPGSLLPEKRQLLANLLTGREMDVFDFNEDDEDDVESPPSQPSQSPPKKKAGPSNGSPAVEHKAGAGPPRCVHLLLEDMERLSSALPPGPNFPLLCTSADRPCRSSCRRLSVWIT